MSEQKSKTRTEVRCQDSYNKLDLQTTILVDSQKTYQRLTIFTFKKIVQSFWTKQFENDLK